MSRLFLCSVALLCAACTTSVKVTRVDPEKPETRVGAPYPLMFTRFEVLITRQISECAPKLKISTKAEIKSAEGAPDPEQLFVIDPSSLSSPLKTSEVTFEYFPNGAVSTLNAVAEDHSAQIVSNVVGSLAKVVSIGAVAGATPLALPPPACSAAVLVALKFAKAQTPVVKAAKAVVDAATEEVTGLYKKISQMNSSVDARTKTALSKAVDVLTLAQSDLDDKQAALEKALKVITYTEIQYWPDHGSLASGFKDLDPAVLTRWGPEGGLDDDRRVRKSFSVFFKLTATGGVGMASRDLSKPDVVETKYGIPYRQPMLGKFSICLGAECSPENLPIAEKIGPVLQLGFVHYLPCESRAFSSVSCTFSVTDAGNLKSMGSAQKTATAEGLSGSVKDAFTQLGSLQETLSGAKIKKMEAQTAVLKAQADYAAAAAALQPDPTKSDADETAILKANTELLDAKRALLEAQAALVSAQAKAAK